MYGNLLLLRRFKTLDFGDLSHNINIVLSSYVIIEKEKDVLNCILDVCNEEGFGCCGRFSNCTESFELILQKKPDIIFLNIDISDGQLISFLLDIFQYLEKTPTLIALSENKEKGYFAIKHNFVDLLLKPINSLSVRKCLVKYNKQTSQPQNNIICLKSNKDFNYVNTEDILFLKADNNTTDISLKDGSIIHSYNTLKVFEKKLPKNFRRIHKSYIINSNFVSRIHYGKGICIVRGNTYKIPFTKTFIDNVNAIKDSFYDKSMLILN